MKRLLMLEEKVALDSKDILPNSFWEVMLQLMDIYIQYIFMRGEVNDGLSLFNMHGSILAIPSPYTIPGQL